MAAHSNIGASSMYRWRACPGSVALSAGIPRSSSKQAAEGTVAHDIVATVLEAWIAAGRADARWQGPFLATTRSADGFDFVVTQEMLDACQLYLDYVWGRAHGRKLYIESRFDLSAVHAGMFGTSDAVIVDEAEGWMEVIDYKHGKGKLVEVEGNPQLPFYGLGALLKHAPKGIHTVKLTIVQPRAWHEDGPIRSTEMGQVGMLEFAADARDAAAEASKPGAPRRPGKHCDFCPALALCPEVKALAKKRMAQEFGPGYDVAELAGALADIPVLLKWAKAVHAFAFGERVRGIEIGDWKLVEKRPARYWKNPTEARAALIFDLGIVESTIMDPATLKSVAEIEKLLPKDRRKELAPLYEKKSSGLALAPGDDKREAYKGDAAAEFASDPENDTED